MRNVILFVILTTVFINQAFADQNIAYPPQAEGAAAGICMEKLMSTKNELDRYRLERNIAVTETNFRIERDEKRWSPITYIVIGLAVGAAGAYFGGKALSK